MLRILLSLIFIVSFNAQAARFLCEPLDEYGFNANALIVELNEAQTEAVVLIEQPDGEFLEYPYDKKIVMVPTIAGQDGRWFGNDFSYPDEEYQVYLSRDNKKMRFWVDDWSAGFSFQSAYSESCREI